jgi:hypothetical protein
VRERQREALREKIMEENRREEKRDKIDHITVITCHTRCDISYIKISGSGVTIIERPFVLFRSYKRDGTARGVVLVLLHFIHKIFYLSPTLPLI